MANNESISFESPSSLNYKDRSDEEEYWNSFPQNLEEIEYQGELVLDNLNFLNGMKSINLSGINKPNHNKPKKICENDNSFLIIDDFDSFYKKFTDMKVINEVVSDKEECKSPSFAMNLDYEKHLVYKCIEDEKELITIENKHNLKNKKKEKEFLVKKEKKLKKKSKSKIFKNLILSQKNSPNKLPKNNQRKRKLKFHIDTNEKFFPLKAQVRIIKNSNQKKEESFSPGYSNQISTYNHSQDGSINSRQDSHPNQKDEEKNNKNGDKYNEENTEKYKENKLEEEMINYKDRIINISDSFIFKFKTKKYFIAPNGKKKRVKKKRKFKPDDIRKKIKARFHKTFKNIINENLKKAGSKLFFDFLPQCFIGNISKKANSKCLELTYKELLSINFLTELNKEDYPNSKVDQNKLKKNIEVLKYLEMNPEICKRSGFDLIKDKKYKDILNIYFTSGQFENSIIQLKEEKESPEYIQEYIKRAKTYVSFYSNVEEKSDKKEINESNEEEEEDEQDEKENKEY